MGWPKIKNPVSQVTNAVASAANTVADTAKQLTPNISVPQPLRPVTNAVQNVGRLAANANPIGITANLARGRNPISQVRQAGNTALRSTQGALRQADDLISRQGVLKYANPLTVAPALIGDYTRGEKKKKELKAEEGRAANEALESSRRVDALRDQLTGSVDTFKRELPGTKQGLLNQVYRNERQALAERMRDIENEYNRRGLLGSSLQKRAQAEAEAQLRSNLAGSEADIDSALQDQLSGYEQAIVDSGLQKEGLSGQQAERDYAEMLQNLQTRQDALRSLLGSAGQAAGTYYGRNRSTGAT